MPPRNRSVRSPLRYLSLLPCAAACGAPALPDSDRRASDASTQTAPPSDAAEADANVLADARAAPKPLADDGGTRDVALGEAPTTASPRPDGGHRAGKADVRDSSVPLSLLIFTRTTGFRHPSIETGLRAIRAMAPTHAWTVTATEDPASLAASLSDSDVVLFLNTSGDVLGPTEEAAFEAWFRAGGGFVGVHAAADTEYEWPFYGEIVGAWFLRHPAIQEATIEVEVPTHASTRHLDETWRRVDEWYDFKNSPRGTSTVLLSLDESSYEGGGMGSDHPIAWTREIDSGRAFYTALGHTEESYDDAAFLAHVAGGIDWAGGR